MPCCRANPIRSQRSTANFTAASLRGSAIALPRLRPINPQHENRKAPAMRLLGYLLLFCVLLSLMRAVLAVALVVWFALLLLGLIFRPAQTLGIVGLCLFLRAFETHPVATIVATGA